MCIHVSVWKQAVWHARLLLENVLAVVQLQVAGDAVSKENASKNSLGSSCTPSNQNLFCWLRHSENGKTLLRRFSTSALLFYSYVPTNANGVYKKSVHLENYSELEKNYQNPLNNFQFQVVQLQLDAVVF